MRGDRFIYYKEDSELIKAGKITVRQNLHISDQGMTARDGS